MHPDKLMIPLTNVLTRHREQILPMLGNEDAMRTVATYAYALLPGLVRLAVKETVFIDFVLSNRDKIQEQLLVK